MVTIPVVLLVVVVIVVAVVRMGYLVRNHPVPDEDGQPCCCERLKGDPSNLSHPRELGEHASEAGHESNGLWRSFFGWPCVNLS